MEYTFNYGTTINVNAWTTRGRSVLEPVNTSFKDARPYSTSGHGAMNDCTWAQGRHDNIIHNFTSATKDTWYLTPATTDSLINSVTLAKLTWSYVSMSGISFPIIFESMTISVPPRCKNCPNYRLDQPCYVSR